LSFWVQTVDPARIGGERDTIQVEDKMDKYDPQDSMSRRDLTDALLALFERAEFIETTILGTKERVFAREVPKTNGTVRVLVYSTIVGSETRKVGKDAIRVCAVYKAKDGQERGIVSDKRINRTGDIAAICERVIARMRLCWTATKTVPHCPKCGAPQFKSKVRKDRYTGRTSGGNWVCADLCWKAAQGYSSQSPRPSNGRSRNDRWNYGSAACRVGYRINPVTGTADVDFAL